MDFKVWLEDVADYHQELFDWLKNQPDDIYVHFSEFPEVKINPRPSHYDPIGVFAFPKSYVLSERFNSNHHFFGMPYVATMQMNSNANVLNLSTITFQEVEQMFEVLGINLTKEPGDKAGRYLWETLDELQRKKDHGQKNIGWNKIFKKFDIDVLLDEGDGIIHNNEPAQVVFLTKSYTILDTYSTNADKIYKKVAKRVITTLGDRIFGQSNYKLQYDSESTYHTRKRMVADGKIQGRPYTITLNYELQQRDYGRVKNKLEHRFHGKVYLNSYLLKDRNYKNHMQEFSIDLSNDKYYDPLSKIVDTIVEKFNVSIHSQESHQDDKSQQLKEFTEDVLKILQFGGKPTYRGFNAEFFKRYSDKTINVNIGYKGEASYGDSFVYDVYINLKQNNISNFGHPVHMSGNSSISAKSVEQNSLLSARKAVVDALNMLEKDVYKHYNPDEFHSSYRQNNWDNWKNAASGKKLLQWIEQLKNKAWGI